MARSGGDESRKRSKQQFIDEKGKAAKDEKKRRREG